MYGEFENKQLQNGQEYVFFVLAVVEMSENVSESPVCPRVCKKAHLSPEETLTFPILLFESFMLRHAEANISFTPLTLLMLIR